MNNPESEPLRRRFSSLSTAELIDHVSDPAVHSGGGTVAALTAASAAGVALLVMRLSAGRKSNRGTRDQILADIDATEHLARALQEAADRDVEILDELMTAYPERKKEGGFERYQRSLYNAAESTLDIASLVVHLLEIVDRQVPYASRFVVSDLGAAAALAEGSGRAALLTAGINIELLDVSGPQAAELPELTARSVELTGRISDLSSAVITASELAMSGK